MLVVAGMAAFTPGSRPTSMMAVMSIVGVNFFLLHGPAPNRVVGGCGSTEDAR
jgi:hypothetical protein